MKGYHESRRDTYPESLRFSSRVCWLKVRIERSKVRIELLKVRIELSKVGLKIQRLRLN